MSVTFVLINLCVLVLMEVLYFKIADRFNIIDKPNHRSSHTTITIRGGGIIFSIAVILFYISSQFQYSYFVIGVLLIATISFLDDVLTLNNKVRLAVQLLSVILMFMQLDLISLPAYWLILAAVFVMGTINAYNFMDGINGITGLYSLLVVVSLYYINSYLISFTAQHLLLITGLSLIVFNFFNFRKIAKCFAGDVGSVSIAFTILFLILQLIIKTEELSYVLLLLIYGLDAVSTIVFRYLRGENIFEAHRSHFYQYLTNERKKPHLVVAGAYALIQLVVNVVIIFVIPHSFFFFSLFLVSSTVIFIIIRFYVEGSAHLLGK